MRRARGRPHVLIATPVKNAEDYLGSYFALLGKLSYPADCLSLGFLESDSTDGTYAALERRLGDLQRRFRRVGLWKHDFGVDFPTDEGRWAEELQPVRRAILARSRNHLLSHALDDEEWVFWVDVDMIEAPADVLDRLLAAGKEIVQPHCVLLPDGPTFDMNGWRDHGRLHHDDFRGGDDVVQLHAVAGTMLSAGLVFRRTMMGAKEGPLFTGVTAGPDSPFSRVADALARRDFLYLVVILSALGLQRWFLAAAAIGSPVYFLLLAALSRGKRRPAVSGEPVRVDNLEG
jgi:hypothetical protein